MALFAGSVAMALVGAYCGGSVSVPGGGGAASGAASVSSSCGGSAASSTSTSSTLAASSVTAGTGGFDAGIAVCPTPDRPASVPEGWIPWTDWSCQCPMWIPGNTPVPPIAWEPCSIVVPQGVVCTQMVTDWSYRANPFGIVAFERDADGNGELFFNRSVDGDPASLYEDYVLARVDGPVMFTLRKPGAWNERCSIYESDFNEGLVSLGLIGDGSTPISLDSNAQGLILASTTDPIPHLEPPRTNNGETWDWSVGKQHIIKGIAPSITGELWAPDFSSHAQFWPPSNDPQETDPYDSPTRIIGSDIIFEVGTLYNRGIMAYDVARGLHPLIRYKGDTSRAAFNFGTDGHDLVWDDESGRTPIPADYSYPNRSIMTAPYTTDPMALKPRRVRSELDKDEGANPFAIGCGYVGHDLPPPADMEIIRLSDGMSWTLPHAAGQIWGRFLGFTCDEAFVTVDLPGKIVRIRLDSLGPGTPPD